MDKIRVVLVDDHEMVRYGLHGILDAEPDMVVVGEAASGEDALRVARELEPDVLLLDVKLAGMDGPEVCRRVLGVSPRINVVMLTSYTQEAVILRSLAAGARGYIVKDIELGALKDAIRSVHRGHTVLDPKITGSLVARMTGRAPHSDPRRPDAVPTATLTELEVQIVQHLSEGHTIGEIAKRVHLSSHTVKDRLAKIRAKLAARSRTGIVAEAMRRGLI